MSYAAPPCPLAFLIAVSMRSFGMLTARALTSARRSAALPSRFGPPAFTTLVNSLPTRSIRLKMVCLRFSKARPSRGTYQIDLAPCTWGEAVERIRTDPNADQPQGRQPDGRRHPPDLTVTSLANDHLEPRIGDRLAKPHRRRARPRPCWLVDDARLGGQRGPVRERGR